MSRKYMVLSAVGPDRPGLVETLSNFVFKRGGNVEATRAATLGGEFAIIMLISAADDEAASEISQHCDMLAELADLSVSIRPTKAPAQAVAVDALPYALKVFSMDHPGIVQAVTAILAEYDINILSLDTAVESAPHTGTQYFNLAAALSIPAAQQVAKVRSELAELAEKLNIDIQISAGSIS